VDQTRTLFANIVPKLCYQMTPHDLNVAILMELSIYHPPRGGKSIRLWHVGLFQFIHTADPPYIQVSLPPDLKNTNSAQCETNENIRPFRLDWGTNLYRLMRMLYLARGDHITETALFLHPYQDNRWRVCILVLLLSYLLSNNRMKFIIFMLLLPFMLHLCTICLNVKLDTKRDRRYGYTNTPIGHNHFQSLFNYALSKTNNIKNTYRKGTNAKGKTKWGHHYLIGSFRKSIITLYGAAGLSTAQIQTYTTHTSAAMVDHYVQQHHLDIQRKENNGRIRDFIDGANVDDEAEGVDESEGIRESPFAFDERSCISCSPSLQSYSRMLYIYIYVFDLTV